MRCAVYIYWKHCFCWFCLTAGPSMANYRVCRCIQSAADATLSVKDQSLAVAIIRNPDNVTELKSSKRRNHALFMEGYSQFGELARAFCS